MKKLEELSLDPNLWNDPKKAGQTLKDKRLLEKTIESYDYISKGLAENIELATIVEDDDEMADQIQQELTKIKISSAKLETECLFSGEADGNDCFLEINAGAGGTESHDWALMMMRMYLRFGERMGFKTEIINMFNAPFQTAARVDICISIRTNIFAKVYGAMRNNNESRKLPDT